MVYSELPVEDEWKCILQLAVHQSARRVSLDLAAQPSRHLVKVYVLY